MQFSRDKIRRVVPVIGVACAVVLLAFPPWEHRPRTVELWRVTKNPRGHFFVFDTLQGENPQALSVIDLRIDFGRLLLQLVFVASLTGLGMWATRAGSLAGSRKPDTLGRQ